MSKLRLDIITIFPEYFEPLRHALLGRAIEQGILTVSIHNLRDWANGKHKSVDSPPLGGGPGMVMKPDVWGPALDSVHAGHTGLEVGSAAPHKKDQKLHDQVANIEPRPYTAEHGEDSSTPLLLVPTPAGMPFTQKDAQAWSREEQIVIACGRYEGIDQRVFEDAALRYRVREVSIGDYVLIGGEAAALVITEAVTRLIPGVLGNTESHEADSFSDGLLEGPCYTAPRQWRGMAAPEVLFTGDHAKVESFRREQSLLRTRAVRPDLLVQAELSARDHFTLDARDVVTRVRLDEAEALREGVEKRLRKSLKKVFFEVADLEVKNDYIEVTGRTALSLEEATQAVVNALPRGTSRGGDSHEL